MPNRAKELAEEAKALMSTAPDPDSPEEKRLYRTIVMYEKEMAECQLIFEDRNRIYKNTFEVLGLIGTIVTLIGDCYRLRNMIIKEPDHGRKYYEQIEDKLRDVVNQAIISLMMLHSNNFEGTDQ